MEGREHSEEVAGQIDVEVHKIIDDAYKVAEGVIKKHRVVLDAIAKALIEKENLERPDFEVILIAHGITPKKKQDIEHQV